ncbi:MAG: Asp23/Gls24 family envelope stress response protein [Actinomycetota bacterium]
MTIAVVSDDGTVTVTDAVLNQIVVQAAESADGTRVLRRRHVEVAIAETGTRVQLELEVAYGWVLPDVARDVQARVAGALGTMCGVNVTAVDVTIEELT